VLLDGRLLEILAEASDVAREVHRLDARELGNILVPIAPGEESPAGMEIRRAAVWVLDRNGEEIQVAAHGLVATGGGDEVSADADASRSDISS
jgi:hypothetical protein